MFGVRIPTPILLYSDGRERPAMQWLRTYVSSPQTSILISPINQIGIVRNPLLVWQSSATATSYHGQVSDNSVFVGMVVDTMVADTTLRLSARAANSTILLARKRRESIMEQATIRPPDLLQEI